MLLAFVLLGCQNDTTPLTVSNLAQNNIEQPLVDASHIEVHHFHLGQGDIYNAVGNRVPAPLAGIIAVPEEAGPHPLVVVVHGATHVASIDDPIYSGFDYLVQQLAAEGYAAISININVDFSIDYGQSDMHEWAYALFDAHVAALKRGNLGEDAGHGIDLSGKIDVNEIHLLGHSRGGQVVSSFVDHDERAGIDRIQSIIRLATVLYFDGEERYPDIPTAIILPEFDGDVESLEGQFVFNYILRQRSHQSVANVIYLRGANHNFFNRMFVEDDRESRASPQFLSQRDRWLTREQQEDFLKRYSVAFFAHVRDEQTFDVFNPSVPQPNTLFDFHLTSSTYLPGIQPLLDVPSETGLATLTTTGSAAADFFVQSFESRMANRHFRHPGVNMSEGGDRLPLYELSWTDTDGRISLTPLITDFSNYQALSIYIAVDSSHDITPAGEDQSLTIVLTDGAGTEKHLLIPVGTSALTYHHGALQIFEEFDMEEWSGYMPLGELRLPLRYFDTLDLTNIATISILFDQTSAGVVMLSNMYLY